MANYRPTQDGGLLICPYFMNHRVKPSQFALHISKCEKQPNAPKLAICPFNFFHRMHPALLESHKLECPEARVFEREMSSMAPQASNTADSTSTSSWNTGNNADEVSDPWAAEGSEGSQRYVIPGLEDNGRKPKGMTGFDYQRMKPAERKKLNDQRVAETLARKEQQQRQNQ